MKRRTGIETAAHVAALREEQARRALLAARAAQQSARDAQEHCRDRLGLEPPCGGTTGQTRAAEQLRAARGQSFREASVRLSTASEERDEAVSAWRSRAQRSNALAQVVDRRRLEQMERASRADQRQLDDIVSARQARGSAR